MSNVYLALSVAVMALTTYLIRMLPLAAFRRKIKSEFVLNFLYYVPYAVLAAMTVPAVFYSAELLPAAVVGFTVAVILSLLERGLLTVAVCACGAVFVTELVIKLL